MLALRLPSLPRSERIFTNPPALEAVIACLQKSVGRGRWRVLSDPRWVGGVSGRDFPSPLRRLLLCLLMRPQVCPPPRPDKHAFVERFHRTYRQEGLQVHHPSTLKTGAGGHRGVSPALQS